MPRPRSDISQRILRAARERFLREGVDGASLRRLARDAGTNLGMVYYYFPTKDALFLAVVEQVYSGLVASLRAETEVEAPFAERLARLYQRFSRLSADEVAVVCLVIRELLTSSTRRRLLADRFLRGHIPLVLGLVSDGLARGELEPGRDPFAVAISMGLLAIFPALIHRLVTEAGVTGIPLPPADQLWRDVHEVVLHGVLLPQGPAT